ncbi:MAG: TMEM165/GDT1 family protein [Clostridia bacterium]|nr:TMEM165/GDT1 family protein [Clostridia bacterium]
MTIWPVVFLTVFIAEMGDKTQLLLVAMAGKYKISHILIGTWAATIVLNLLAVGVGAALSHYLDMRIIKAVAALAFFYFAFAALQEDKEETAAPEKKHGRIGPIFAIFGSFFLGELGDKTQLSAITLAATYATDGWISAAWVFLGCTLGLILADLLGLIVGVVLKRHLPEKILHIVSFLIFAVFGVTTAFEACQLTFGAFGWSLAVTIGVTVLFAALCGFMIWRQKRQKK